MSEVITLAGWPPETLAYAYAMYSRSALSIRQSINKITAEKSSKFLETFYFQYGHKSIADNAHVPLALENISQIAAYTLEDEQLWDGQERSTRFQNFNTGTGYFIPDSVKNTPLESDYTAVGNLLLEQYAIFSDKGFNHLTKIIKKPADMKTEDYERKLKARAFDVARFWLFGGILTSVGQVTSARTLESQIVRLMSSEYSEIKELAYAMQRACTEKPFCPEGKDEPPVAPTLVKYTKPNHYLTALRDAMRLKVSKYLPWCPVARRYVQLAPPMSLTDELVATLLYEASQFSFQEIAEAVSKMSPGEKQGIVNLALVERGKHDPVPKAFSCGYQLRFDIVMDRGGERDLHRHRNCIQIHQPLSLDHGYDMPQMVAEMGLENVYRSIMADVGEKIRKLGREIGVDANYLIPFAYRSATLYKMHLAQAFYMIELRSGVMGHFSYRKVACKMHEQLIEMMPELAGKIRVTPFDQVDLLKR